MAIHLNSPRDLVLLNLVGFSVFRLIVKARSLRHTSAETSASPAAARWNEETAIGYEASWTGMRRDP